MSKLGADNDRRVRLQVNLKTPTGQLFNIYAEDANELDDLLTNVEQGKFLARADALVPTGPSQPSNGYSGAQNNSGLFSGSSITVKVDYNKKTAFKDRYPMARWNSGAKGWDLPAGTQVNTAEWE